MLENTVLTINEVRAFARLAVSNELGHAYILFSEDSYLRTLLINIIPKLILCPNGGCHCKICNMIDNQSYVDVKTYNCQTPMKVKDSQELIEDAYTTSYHGGYKLYFIDNATTLSPQVQNKLLKIFEEPPQNVIIFLLSANENGILKTVMSRAIKLYLPVFSAKDVYDELIANGISEESAKVSAAYSGGRLDKAFKYSEDDNYRLVFDSVFDILINCKSSAQISGYLNALALQKDNLALGLEFLEIILRDVLECVSNGKNYITIAKEFDIMSISKGFSDASAAMALQCVYEAKKMLSFNVNALSVAERVLFQILEAKYKWQ